MQLHILSSSSVGNCYLLSNNSETLIIEAGINFASVKKALDYDLSKVVGCLVTHKHGDHSKYVKDFANSGIVVMALESVLEFRELKGHHRGKPITAGKGYKLGNFRVYVFEVAHDVPCVGFLISHPETGNILFLTDTFTCEYKFDNLSTIMVEANYSDKILEANIQSGRVNSVMRKRLLYSHMELETTKRLVLNHDLTQVNNIILLHLSSENSNANLFKKEIEEATGKVVYVANRGLKINIDEMPY